tara:strand:- start:279 stop:500 length:222 start_codon:yes stop_codon:yes gene_type:complete
LASSALKAQTNPRLIPKEISKTMGIKKQHLGLKSISLSRTKYIQECAQATKQNESRNAEQRPEKGRPKHAQRH